MSDIARAARGSARLVEDRPSWRRARALVLLFCHRLLAEHLVAYTAGNINVMNPSVDAATVEAHKRWAREFGEREVDDAQ